MEFMLTECCICGRGIWIRMSSYMCVYVAECERVSVIRWSAIGSVAMNESSRGHLSTLPPYVCTHIYHSAQLRTHTYTQIHVCTYAYIHTQIKTNLHFSLDVFVYLSIFYSHPFLFDFLFDFHLLTPPLTPLIRLSLFLVNLIKQKSKSTKTQI